MRSTLLRTTSIALVAMLAGGCGTMEPRYSDRGYQDSRSYDRYDNRYDNRYDRRCANCGVVERIDMVWAHDRASGGGAVIGAVIGGVVGNQIGSGSGRDAATVAGAIAGGVIGHRVEQRQQGDRQYYQFQIRLDDGRWATVTQRNNPGVRVGSRVIIENDQLSHMR